jgi:hypothetical protein
MKPLILILSFSIFAPLLLNCCVGDSEVKLWNRHLSEEERIPVLTKTSGKLTYQKSKDSVIATIVCPNWPWYDMKANWPEGAPLLDQADVEVIEEKWMGGGRLVGRVISNGKTLYDASICEKHNVSMVRRNPIPADAQDYPDKAEATSYKHFPNAGIQYHYGCNSGLTPSVWRCQVCYEGFERWTKRLGISE